MRRGTTPTLTFTTPYTAAEITIAYVTFSQRGAVILDKEMGDSGIVVSDYEISVTLTQEESLAFSALPSAPVKAQIRAVLANGDAVASNIVEFPACPILKEGEI